MIILALDPGGTTGMSVCNYVDDGVDDFVGEWRFGQIGPQPHHEALWTLMADLCIPGIELRIVCESFEYRNNSRAGLVLDSVEYIGIVKLFVARYGVPLTMQTASMGKGFTKDQNIKKLGLWQSGKKHANDATRHLLYYLATNEETPTDLQQEILKRGWK